MTKQEFAKYQDDVFNKLKELRDAGQKEYAGGEDAFGNFNRLAESLKMDRKKILWVYLMKHMDGITSFLNGHISQRESVEGRINDAVIYLILLRGMITEEKLFKANDVILNRKEIEREEYDSALAKGRVPF